MNTGNDDDDNNDNTTKMNNKNICRIRAKDVRHQVLLQAAADGDLELLMSNVYKKYHEQRGSSSKDESRRASTAVDEDGFRMLRQAVCTSGCSVLHWAAGNDHLHVVQFLLSSRTFCDVDQPAVKKSLGRTPLHYCCRNGHIETAKWLVHQAGANVRARAKHGVTPFQMAVWQNRLDICQWLVEECGVVAADEVNDFQCSPVHWIGICPVNRANHNRGRRRRSRSCDVQDDDGDDNDDVTMNDHDHVRDNDDPQTEITWYEDGRDLIPLATWLAEQPGIDFHRCQRQGHTSLHKASWGGHLALIKYLHTRHGMWDDVVDDAGNYSASLSDMANTPRHDAVSKYLREVCSRDRVHSCEVLGVPTTASKVEIRKAYLNKARMFHPDRRLLHSSDYDHQLSSMCENSTVSTFTDGTTEKYSFDEIRKAYVHLTELDGRGNQSNPAHSLNLMLQASGISKEDDDEDSFFKARLVAVLLEYGDKGIDLSNVRKKWKQVWPNEPFPTTTIQASSNCGGDGNDVGGSNSKEIPLSTFLAQKAGDYIRLETDIKTGSLRVYPRNCSRAQVAQVASSNRITARNQQHA